MLVVSVISPLALGAFAAAYVASRKVHKHQVANTFYYLERKGYVQFDRKKGNITISLTRMGDLRLQRYRMNVYTVPTQKKWDGKWRMVFFDIPAEKKVKRDALRSHLKRLRFHKFQKSVWVHPYPCEREIVFIKDYLKIPDRELQIITTDNLGEQAFLKKIFKLAQ